MFTALALGGVMVLVFGVLLAVGLVVGLLKLTFKLLLLPVALFAVAVKVVALTIVGLVLLVVLGPVLLGFGLVLIVPVLMIAAAIGIIRLLFGPPRQTAGGTRPA